MTETVYGGEVNNEVLASYFKSLVNQLFKILPMRENNEETRSTYMESLIREVSGFQWLFDAVKNDAGLTQILSILQYLAANPDCEVQTVRQEVFRAISICNKLKARYAEGSE